MTLPESFPALPGLGPPTQQLQSAYNIISDHYRKSLTLLLQEDYDPLRLRFYSEHLRERIFPLFNALSSEELPTEWLEACAHILGKLLLVLRDAIKETELENTTTRVKPQLVTVQPTGEVGRPAKMIDVEWLREALSSCRRLTLKNIAATLGIHRNTLRIKLHELGFNGRFTALSEMELDQILRVYKKLRPNSGLRYATGFLQAHNIKLPRERIRQSLGRIDTLGTMLRHREVIQRREYVSRYSNAVWHIDGMHKLILWGFVIHGGVDGHDHTVVALRANTNNRASTVLQLFQESIAQFGCPSRVRGDRGGENIALAAWMIMRKGPGRGSFIWGTSMRNTRIERLWVEVAKQFSRCWRGFFLRLERQHFLDRHNKCHLWLLHYLFLKPLNVDCDAFKRDWNMHPLSGHQNMTPLDIRFLNQATHGVATVEDQSLHPDTISRYYDADGEPINRGSHQENELSDADSSDSNESESFEGSNASGISTNSSNGPNDLWRQIAADIRPNIRHKAVKAPRSQSPFDDPIQEGLFKTALAEIQSAQLVPNGYGVRSSEWDEDGYPDVEVISLGRKKKDIVIDLPEVVWLPRAIAWVQALHLMQSMLYHMDADN